jgi:hypothetical protein
MKKGFVLAFLLLWAASSAFAAPEKPLRVKASIAGGYDNNTGLNPFRKGDGLAQESVSLLYKRLLTRKAQVQLSYNAFNANYFEATDLNFFMNQLGAGVDYLVTPGTVWETDYTFEYLDFLNNASVTSYKNEVRTGLKRKLSDRWMLRAGVSASQREYTDKKLRQPEGILSPEDERGDLRVSMDASTTYKLRPDMFLSAGTVLYRNDSNDQFQDYYDYDAYRYFAGLSWQFRPKWMVSGKFSYEMRDYLSRPRSGGSDDQADDIYTTNLSLYYKWDKNLTVGSIYTYRQKESNEPSQEYSGSLGTLGLYYSF